jgi:quinolinate synthase
MNSALERIEQVRKALGDELVILAHHYQRKEIVALGDFVGDSYILSKQAAESRARLIVFCGVHFMAEAACILAKADQQVFMPDPRAGCPMADMADADDARLALERMGEVLGPGKKILPITYINSTADVKNVVGRAGGLACTSANASKALRWAADQGDLLFFLPDEFLGTNTARLLGYGPVARWNPHLPDGGLTPDEIRTARVVVWQGYCHVHTFFTPEMVAAARERNPGCTVVVHPECRPEVVDAADGAGSTTYLVQAVEKAGPGSVTVVGTEVNLVLRLAGEFPDRRVLPLDYSLCPNMYRTNLEKLANVLERFDSPHRITVPTEVVEGSRLALQRMLAL